MCLLVYGVWFYDLLVLFLIDFMITFFSIEMTFLNFGRVFFGVFVWICCLIMLVLLFIFGVFVLRMWVCIFLGVCLIFFIFFVVRVVRFARLFDRFIILSVFVMSATCKLFVAVIFMSCFFLGLCVKWFVVICWDVGVW